MSHGNISEQTAGLMDSWLAANQAHIEAEMSRLRVLLHRRIMWLRQVWKRDPLQGFRDWVISDSDADRLLDSDRWKQEEKFYQEDPAAARLSREIAVHRENSGAAARDALATGGPPAIEILVHLFHLDEFDREALLLCLAPELDPAFDRLYAYIQDDASRKYPTAHLAIALHGCGFFGTMAAAWNHGLKHFRPDASLLRSRLIRCEAAGGVTRGGEALRLEGRIFDYLMGLNRLDEQAAFFLRPLEDAAPVSSGDEVIAGQLEQLLRSWNGRGRMPAINFFGPRGAALRGVAASLCGRLGIGFFEIDLARLPTMPRERQDLFRLLERDAVLLPSAYFIDATEIDRKDRAAVASAAGLIQDLRSFLFVASRDPWRSERELLSVEIPKLQAAAQRDRWETALGKGIAVHHHAAAGDTFEKFLDSLVEQYDFSLAEIQQVSDSARGAAQLRDPSAAAGTTRDVWNAARALASNQLDGLAQRIVSGYAFDDLVLPADTLQQLRDIAAQVSLRGQVYERWGFGARLGRGKGIAALFAGPSGTGKTMAAEVIANDLRLDLYRVDLSRVVSKYIGETEKNLRQVFDAAEQSGAILFFDEADALFGKRSEVRDSHDRYANIEINYLLQRMEDYRGLAILATNMKSLLDQAFLRRLRFLVDFPFPSAAQRMRIWRGAFPAAAETENLDYEFLGRLEITGGNIKNIALNAAFLAAGAGAPIGMQHLLMAARREYSKIDKLVVEFEFGRYFAAVRR